MLSFAVLHGKDMQEIPREGLPHICYWPIILQNGQFPWGSPVKLIIHSPSVLWISQQHPPARRAFAIFRFHVWFARLRLSLQGRTYQFLVVETRQHTFPLPTFNPFLFINTSSKLLACPNYHVSHALSPAGPNIKLVEEAFRAPG